MSVFLRPFSTCLAVGICCILFSEFSIAQSDSRSSSSVLYAEPKAQGANPLLPSLGRKVRLPVVLQGFCVVSLRESQKWASGQEAHQLIFDGQLYWFASQRKRAMFAASPHRYVPALGGSCVVTYAETDVRTPGNPRFGLLHNQRLYFFKGQKEKEAFESNPAAFSQTDLANQGLCLVSKIDEGRELPGLAETVVVIDGLRYHFAGLHQQQSFLSKMRHYGVTAPATAIPAELMQKKLDIPAPLQALKGSQTRESQKFSKSTSTKPEADLSDKAMGGYCPVSFKEQSLWVPGKTRFPIEFDGQTYLTADEATLAKFTEDPNAYIPALGGHCVVTEIDNNRRTRGSIYHAAQYDDRLYLFAGPEQKQAFKASPGSYLHADLAVEGNCIVTHVDQGKQVAGLPELLVWHDDIRYLFASPELRDQFRNNIERYRER